MSGTSPIPARAGGDILVRHLMLNGVRRVFMVAGESFLPCIDALYANRDAIETISFRQEAGAAFAALSLDDAPLGAGLLRQGVNLGGIETSSLTNRPRRTRIAGHRLRPLAHGGVPFRLLGHPGLSRLASAFCISP